jgi:hypothetical protein
MKRRKSERLAIAQAAREIIPHERVKVKPGLWIELPLGLTEQEKNHRIEKYLAKLEEKHPIYNPKAA